MPTRPVTWDLDIPPADLLEGAKNTSPASEEAPSLNKLRASLLGTRFEVLKISTFAAFLMAFVGVAIHGSHLTSPDNQFAANTRAAAEGLATAISDRTASLRGKTKAFALEATQKAKAVVGQTSESAATIAPLSARATAKANEAPPASHAREIARAHSDARSAQQFKSTSPQPHRSHHARRGGRAVAGIANEVPSGALVAARSAGPVALTDFVSAEVSGFGHRILGLMQGGVELSGLPDLPNKGRGALNSFGSHFDVTNPAGLALRSPSTMLAALASPESLLAAMAGLMLYMIFVVVLVRLRGGQRALGGSHAV